MSKMRLTIYWEKYNKPNDKVSSTQIEDLFLSDRVLRKIVMTPSEVVKYLPKLKQDIIDNMIPNNRSVEIHNGPFLIASFYPNPVIKA